MGLTDEQLWAETWKAAGPAFAAQRRDELRRLSPDRALFFADAALSLVRPGDIPPRRRTHSGLVEQQALFAPLRRR